MKVIKSIYDKQEEIINDILFLHNNGKSIDLDCTYSKGVFYKNGEVIEPKIKSDLNPINDSIIQSCSSNLDFINEYEIESIIFDPPFIISGKSWDKSKEGSCKTTKRFGAYYSFDELKNHYYNSLKEFHRILKKNGIIIFKLQNTVSSGKNHFTHFFVLKSALELGLKPIDEFILISKSKMTSFGGRWKRQIHAMKYHSYFLIFRKTKNNVNYE